MHKIDPRIFQIFALSALVLFGVYMLDFAIRPNVAMAIVLSAVFCELFWSKSLSSILSALISALSLCLLLRTNTLALASLASVIAISSKYCLRLDNRHLFNPTAFALVVSSSLFDNVWISPGQWGHTAYLLILVVGAGTLVSSRATRIDTSLSFLGAFALICVLRALYLGDPMTIPVHQLSSGALLIFAFFMISDPRTTPTSRSGRIIFSFIVALTAAYIEFGLYRPNGAIFALIFSAPLVPLLNKFLPGATYQWPAKAIPSFLVHKFGAHHG